MKAKTRRIAFPFAGTFSSCSVVPIVSVLLLLQGTLQPQHISSTKAFFVPPPSSFNRNVGRRYGAGGDGHNNEPPRNFGRGSNTGGDDGFNDNDNPNVQSLATQLPDASSSNQTRSANATLAILQQRGGSTKTKPHWKGAFGSVAANLARPFQIAKKKASNLFKDKETKAQEALLEQLKTIPIRRVIAPNSTVLPPEVVQIAAKHAGLLGNPLRTDRVQDLARTLKQWYLRQGYVLHSVTGATLKSDTATAVIEVQEPRHSRAPVEIAFFKEMVHDPDSGELLTMKQYRERQNNSTDNSKEPLKKESSDLKTMYVPTAGRTKPSRIARALGLRPGQPFCWDEQRWQQVAQSGLFARILDAAPQSVPGRDGDDDGVQLRILATEAPFRHLEYGVGKSLYTGGWEGELDFEHANLLGGGETLGVSVRQGPKDTEPSIRLKFSDGRLALVGGYDVQAFSEFIGDRGVEETDGGAESSTKSKTGAAASPNKQRKSLPTSYDTDVLMNRRGVSLHVKNPIDPRTIRHSVASLSLERTATQSGLGESIGSSTVEVGPFLRELPLGARSNFEVGFTAGARLASDDNSNASKFPSTSTNPSHIKPYASVSGTTRQLFPLQRGSSKQSRPLVLALRHRATASTPSVPRHVAKAIGTSSNIRGTSPNGRVSSALSGTAELRVPIQLPARLQTPQDMSVVVFGDWLLATKDAASPFYRKSCVGLGLRKSVQGIPVQYDVTYSRTTGKVKGMFGLGRDFVF